MSVDEDPQRLIFAYCGHLKVPTWVPDKAQPNCKACNEKLSSGDRHHCRLDGNLYCGQCTGKYYVPVQFNINAEKKSGTVRVCYGCKEECFQQRLKEQSLNIAKAKSSGPLKADEEAKLTMVKPLPNHSYKDKEIAPPSHWVESRGASDECSKCHEKGKQHNCRTCGLLYCSKCTSKMAIAAYFEKKQKSGPMRVCDECRYKITSGYKMVEKLSEAVEQEKAAQSAAAAGFVTSSSVKTCVIVGCREKVVTSTGLCAVHASQSTSVKSDQVATSASVAIYFEGKLTSAIAKVPCTPTMNLKEIDAAFRRMAPQNEPYQYILKGDPIPESFWEMFNVGKIGQQIVIRKKPTSSIPAHLMDEVATIQPAQFGPNDKNPFKRSDNDAAIAEKQRLEEEAKKPKFHKPGAIKVVKAKPNSTPYEPLQPKGASGSVQLQLNCAPISVDAPVQPKPGQSLDDLLKLRAKNIFGQQTQQKQ